MVKKDEKTTSTNAGETQTASTGEGTAADIKATPDYGKQLTDLQSTISGQGETIKELQEAVVAASIISNTIASDPNLRTNFETALKKQYGGVQTQQQNQEGDQNQNSPTNQNQNSPVTQIEKDVKEVKDADRNRVITDFEKEAGILNLPEEDRKVARQKVEGYLNSFGWSVSNLPLTSLRDSLDKAYVGTIGIERAKEEGKVEALTSYRANEKGVMGGFSGSSLPTGEEEVLNSKQQEWLKKLKVEPERAKKVYAEQGDEKSREKPVK
jgi:hypothetical protein